jgi:RNA recognition motif-containing protein
MQLDPPADKSIITLWLGNVEPDMSEADIRAVIYPYGQIASFHLLRSARCAFVEYVDREAAEGAAAQLYNALMVNGRALSVNWARPKVQGDNSAASDAASSSHVMLPPPGMERAPTSAYVLPGMPAPVTSWPPVAAAEDEAADGAHKRQRTEGAAPQAAQTQAQAQQAPRPKFAPAPPRAPPPSSVGLLTGLSAYGEDSDEEQAAVAFETGNNRRGGGQAAPKKAGIQYPSMNPSRMGASI